MTVMNINDQMPQNGAKHKDDGVKKLVIIGIAENITESYSNLQSMFKPMNIHQIKFYGSMDLKVATLILGLQPAASTFPFIYCENNRNCFGLEHTQHHWGLSPYVVDTPLRARRRGKENL